MGNGGWILGAFGLALGLEIAFSHRVHAEPVRPPRPTPPTPPGHPPPHPVTSFPSGTPSMDPDYSLQTWTPVIMRLTPIVAPRAPFAFTAKWGEIESDWNPCAV